MQFSSFQTELVPQKQWKELSRNCFRPGSYLCYDKKVIGNITSQAECLWSFPSIHLIGWIGGKQGACFSLKTFSALSYSQLCESICPSVPFIAFWVAGWRWEVLRWGKRQKSPDNLLLNSGIRESKHLHLTFSGFMSPDGATRSLL